MSGSPVPVKERARAASEGSTGLERWDTRSPWDLSLRSVDANVLIIMALGAATFVTAPLAFLYALEVGGAALILLHVPLFWIAVWAFLTAGLVKGTVTAGADGLVIEWARGWRFVAYRDIADVSADGEHVRLVLRNHKVVRLRALQADQIVKRVGSAIAQDRGAEDSLEAREAARGDGSVDEWIARIERLGSSAGGYREASLDREGFLRVVADEDASPSARAGAALVLSQAKMTDDERRTIRSAAKSSAHPKVRVALETVADEVGVERARRAVREAG
jgi:hypothetical protein